MDEVQLRVAKKLNHQRNINKKSLDNAMEKFSDEENKQNEKIDLMKTEIKAEKDKEKKEKLIEKLGK